MPSDLQVSNIRDQANANSAITIASDGQITVNQNNPTVTLGSNTTFPAGMVRNIVTKSSFASQTFDSDEDVILQLGIPNVLASSKIYVSYKVAIRLATGNTSAEGMEVKVFRGGTSQNPGDATDGSRVSPDGGHSASTSFIYKNSVNIEMYVEASGFFIDASPDTGTNTYKLVGSSYTGTPGVGQHDGQTQFSLMEVTV